MSDADSWYPCELDPHGCFEVPAIHDNFVYAFAVDLDQRFLILHTEYRDEPGPAELVDVRFVDCVAHHFDDVMAPSILLDIGQIDIPLLIDLRADLFTARGKYGWPLNFEDLADLSRKLVELGVTGFRVNGTCGLDGFVLASRVEYRRRTSAAEFA